jgi:hypothetical protein
MKRRKRGKSEDQAHSVHHGKLAVQVRSSQCISSRRA